MYPENIQEDGTPKGNVLENVDCRLTAYNGTKISFFGCIEMQCKYKDAEWLKAKFFVVDVSGPAMLGLQTCESLSIVTMNCSIENSSMKTEVSSVSDLMKLYPGQFDRIGKFKNAQKLKKNSNISPSVCAPRKLPIELKDKIKSELDWMEGNGVIKRIETATEWVSAIAYQEKQDGSYRICLDPKHLNSALIRPYHNTPTVQDINYKLADAKVLSKLDAKCGYWFLTVRN